MTALAAPDRRLSDRRVSPAVGQFAIQECARLRESNAELVKVLQAILDTDDGDELFWWKRLHAGFAEQARAAILKAQP